MANGQGLEPSSGGDAPLVTGVDFVAVPARDFEESVRFYGEVLGLPAGKRWEIARERSSTRAT